MEPLRAALSAQTVELEGHGDTPPAGDAYSMPRFVVQLRAAIVSQGRGPATLVGYSMGGYVALLLAAESPELVSRVVTLGTKLAWTPEFAAKETGRLDPVVIRAKVPPFAEQLEQRHRAAGGWETVLRKTAALMTSLGANPLVDEALLKRVAQPVRLMVGDRDAVVSVEETRAAAKQLGKGELAVLPGTPHPIEQVRVDLVASMVRDFA
jgi:pimeloyl-ACP methyl ester carboxylesterase